MWWAGRVAAEVVSEVGSCGGCKASGLSQAAEGQKVDASVGDVRLDLRIVASMVAVMVVGAVS